MSDRLLTTRQVADVLGLSPETVLRRYRAGELRGIRLASNVLRFRESELEAWLAERSTYSGDRGAGVSMRGAAAEDSGRLLPRAARHAHSFCCARADRKPLL